MMVSGPESEDDASTDEVEAEDLQGEPTVTNREAKIIGKRKMCIICTREWLFGILVTTT